MGYVYEHSIVFLCPIHLCNTIIALLAACFFTHTGLLAKRHTVYYNNFLMFLVVSSFTCRNVFSDKSDCSDFVIPTSFHKEQQ